MQLHVVHYVVQRSCFVFVIKIVVVVVVCVFYKHLVSSKMLNFRSRKYKLNFSYEMNWKCNYFFKTLFVLFHVCVCVFLCIFSCVCVFVLRNACSTVINHMLARTKELSESLLSHFTNSTCIRQFGAKIVLSRH